MKILKHKNITGIILGLLLLMPFLSILARSAYVVVNKNAYQSYSEKYVSENVSLPNGTEYNDGQTYYLTYYETDGSTSSYTRISYSEISIDWNDILGVSTDFSSVNCVYLRGDGQIYLYYLNNSTETQSFIYGQSDVWGSLLTTFYCVYEENYVFTTFNYSGQVKLETYTFVIDSLDNVFEYSVSNFVEDNNIGNLDLTSWFFDIFLEDNSVNNLYVNFANWYMNYAMLITLMHFLFLVLMWFINYSRRLLDRGMNYDW